MKQKTFACHDCDALIHLSALQEGEVASCPRCHHSVVDKKHDSINRTFAVSASGLLLFIPATMSPLLSMKILSVTSSASLFSSVEALWSNQLYFVTCLVALFCLLTPLIKLLSAFLVCLGYKLKLQHNETQQSRYRSLLRFYHYVDSWEMLEVFLIGILISIIKLKDMAELEFNIGLLCFAALMLCVITLKVTLDKQMLWDDFKNV